MIDSMSRKTIAVGLAASLCLAAIGIVAVVAIQDANDANLSSERSKLSATAQVTAAFVAQQMDGVGELEQLTVKRADLLAAMGTGDPSHYQLAVLQVILGQLEMPQPDFAFAGVSDASGTLQAISPPTPSLLGQNFRNRDWYAGAIRTGATYVSSTYVSAVAGAPLLVGVATPIFLPPDVDRPDFLIGILVVGYRIGSVQAFANQLAALQQIGLDLADQRGVLMTRGGIAGHLGVASEAPVILAALHGRSITTLTSGLLSAGAPVPGIGWAISVSTPLSATPVGAGNHTITAVAVGLLLALGFGGCAIIIVTGRLERASALHKRAEDKLHTIQESVTDGIIAYDAEGRFTSMNRAAQHLLEVQPGESSSALAAKWEFIRENGSVVSVQDNPLISPQCADTQSEQTVVGIQSRAKQTVQWLSISASPILDQSGRVSGYVSSVRDISERLETIRALRIVSNASAEMSASLVADRVIDALTKAASELCSAPGEPRRRAQVYLMSGATMIIASEHDPDNIVRLKGVTHRIDDHPHVKQVIMTREATTAYFDHTVLGPTVEQSVKQLAVTNGVWVPMIRDNGVFAVLAVSGRQNGLVGAATLEHLKALVAMAVLAVTNANLHDQIAHLARTDPLTGSANRRALDERMSQLPRLPFAFVAIDVDGLKNVNDRHGHAAGDELLVSVARTLNAEIRSSDVLARTGGDEFVALMVGTDATGARELAGRMKTAVSSLRLASGVPSVSVGSAAGRSGDDPAIVARHADVALYAAKRRRYGKLPRTPAGAHL